MVSPATADRVLVHVDTEQAREDLIHSRRAYVALAREPQDAHTCTGDAKKLG
jgi:hypothetical protein